MPQITDVYLRYGIPYRVTEARGGWVSTHCPHCRGSADFHLGYNIRHGYYRCWRCGWHDTISTLVALCHVDLEVARRIYAELRGTGGSIDHLRSDQRAQARVGISRYRHPPDTGPLRANHVRYLESRGFDPEQIARQWGVLGTGPVARLDDIDYRYRLLIPIRWGGEEVSFQTRDVTNRADRKYVACPTDREIRHHKYVLYGRQEDWGETGVIVEGVTDVWRLGGCACAVFGIQYRSEQVIEIVRHFRRVVIVFDAERQAQRVARRLAASLRTRLGSEIRVVDLGGGDPGSLAQDDANHLVRELTRSIS